MTQRILYVEGNPDGTVGGSFFVLLDLVLGLDRTRFEPIVVFRFDNFVADRMRAAGVTVLINPPVVPLTFERRWLAILMAPIKKLVNLFRGLLLPTVSHAAYLKRNRIDLVNLNNSITRNHPWMVAALLTGTRCLTHEMGINKSYSWLSRYLGRRLDAVVAVSHAIHDAMRKGGAASPNITVVHNGIDTRRYRHDESPQELRRKHGIPDDAPVTGVVGNIRMWKGQETMVRAAATLRRRFPGVRCLLVGGHASSDLAYLERLQSLCRELDIESNVIFTGFQKNAIDYMRLMDVVAHTSIEPEPFGIVMLEAMSLAKPLVSTTIGGPAEIVVDGVSGTLVEPGKPELLAAAIAAYLADPAKAAAAGAQGLLRLQAEFAIEKNLQRTLEVYDRIFHPATPGRRSA